MSRRTPAARIEALRAYAAEGLSQKEAAARLGIHPAQVSYYAKNHEIDFIHGGTKRAKNDSRVEPMAVMYRSGATLQQIGDHYGVTRERVRQLLTGRLGIRGSDGGQSIIDRRNREKAQAAHDRKCLDRMGCTFQQWRQMRDLGREMRRTLGVSYSRTPTGAYISQRNNARKRGIAWEISLWDWWQIWQQSGRWEQRGRGSGFVMCRFNDVGPYKVGNVFIATGVENSSRGRRLRSDLPIGVRSIRGGAAFCAVRCIDGVVHRLGQYPTVELAEAAYKAGKKIEQAIRPVGGYRPSRSQQVAA